jgi:hypothetical protein
MGLRSGRVAAALKPPPMSAHIVVPYVSCSMTQRAASCDAARRSLRSYSLLAPARQSRNEGKITPQFNYSQRWACTQRARASVTSSLRAASKAGSDQRSPLLLGVNILRGSIQVKEPFSAGEVAIKAARIVALPLLLGDTKLQKPSSDKT